MINGRSTEPSIRSVPQPSTWAEKPDQICPV